VRKLALALVAVAVASAAQAESPRSGSFSLRGQTYAPDVDSEFGGAATPYGKIFGDRNRWMFKVEAARAVFDKLGTVELGGGVGYFTASGNGRDKVTGAPTADTTSFSFVPTSIFAQYRFDWLADRYNIPLAPYAKLAFERYNWWVTGTTGKQTKTGATNGWSATGGLAILLDFFDPTLAREMDRDTGINHSYLFVDVSKATVDDFGSGKSWDLSGKGVSLGLGLMFVF
jgi:hypothetical protein